MKVRFRKSFTRDLRKLQDPTVKKRLRNLIPQLEDAEAISSISNLVRLAGAPGFYRMRIGDYRLGLVVDGDSIELVRLLHRREIYRYFP